MREWEIFCVKRVEFLFQRKTMIIVGKKDVGV